MSIKKHFWFIPTKKNQQDLYNQELKNIPKEVSEITEKFVEKKNEYDKDILEFENEIIRHPKLYELYLKIKSSATEINILNDRIMYKNNRRDELSEMLIKL